MDFIDGFSVIMPTYNQGAFIRRAIKSLCEQTYKNWELIIVNDGCTDNTEKFIADYLISHEYNVRYIKNKTNEGIGFSINKALEIAQYPYIAYLPSDDFYEPDHLLCFKEQFDKSDDIVLVYSGLRFDRSESKNNTIYVSIIGVRSGYSLQLVQAAHKKTEDRWIERGECVSEDLFFTFWHKLTDKGIFVPTKQITCEWTNHPNQRHKITGEKFYGGLNIYRDFYKVKKPIRYRNTNYKITDELLEYKPYRLKNISLCENSLKILLVGDLAYNPERIYAFEEAGHILYGLWSKPACCYSAVGKLPFGNVEDIPYESWKKIHPDIIYAQISTGAIDITCEIMKAGMNIPLVWHFKESPQESLKAGLWEKLIELYTRADGKIYLSEYSKRWFEQFILPNDAPTFIMDPELPKKECFTDDFSPKISDTDNAIHTVVTGRIIGLTPGDIAELAKHNIHIHVYNQNYISEMINFENAAPQHFHIHKHCSQSGWVKEFSQYDAGWLHCFNSDNNGNIMRAIWSDLNIPARISVFVAAGLPMIQKDNSKHLVAMYNYVKDKGVGIFYKSIDCLAEQLKNKYLLKQTSNNVLTFRDKYTFDYHLPQLIEFFKKVIEYKRNK